MSDMSFGEFLKLKRREKNLTQKDLANELYVSESTVSKWEKDVAHPDLSMVGKLSEILGVTEHELINASVDNLTRTNSIQAKKWRTLSFSWNLFFYISYGIALFTCFIVNLAVDKTLSWFFIVLFSILLSTTFTTIPQYIKSLRIIFIPLSELTALLLLLLVCNIYLGGKWFLISAIPIFFGFIVIFLPIIIAKATIIPKAIKKHNALICIVTDFILLLLMLLYVCLYVGGSWFIDIALPFSSLVFFISLVTVLIIRYLKTNRFIKAGLSLLLWDFFVGLGGIYIVVPILENAGVSLEDSVDYNPFSANFSIWQGDCISYNVTLIIFICLTILSVLFIILGINRYKKQSKKNK